MIPDRSNLLVAVTLVIHAAALGGCSDVEPIGRPEPLLVPAGAGPLVDFRIVDAGDEVLWAIEADRPRQVGELIYGIVPEGFRQTVPPGGEAPRPFDPGESLHTLTRSQRRLFVHQGFASGFGSFSIVDSRMELLARSGAD